MSAASPYVTAVGGTMNGPKLTNSPEIVCSTALGGGITSGGGFSDSIAAPSFQSKAISGYIALASPTQSTVQPYNASNRGYPDVSMSANNYGTYSN